MRSCALAGTPRKNADRPTDSGANRATLCRRTVLQSRPGRLRRAALRDRGCAVCLAHVLSAVRADVFRAGAVVGRFLRNADVMRMTLLNGGRAHEDKAGPRAQLLNVPGAAIAHSRPQAAHQLIDERGQV